MILILIMYKYNRWCLSVYQIQNKMRAFKLQKTRILVTEAKINVQLYKFCVGRISFRIYLLAMRS